MLQRLKDLSLWLCYRPFWLSLAHGDTFLLMTGLPMRCLACLGAIKKGFAARTFEHVCARTCLFALKARVHQSTLCSTAVQLLYAFLRFLLHEIPHLTDTRELSTNYHRRIFYGNVAWENVSSRCMMNFVSCLTTEASPRTCCKYGWPHILENPVENGRCRARISVPVDKCAKLVF